MSTTWSAAASWLGHCAIGGGLLLLLTCALQRLTHQPVRRQRLGEWGMAAALTVAVLSLGPAWLIVAWPVAPDDASETANKNVRPTTATAFSLPIEPFLPEPIAIEAANDKAVDGPAMLAMEAPPAAPPDEAGSPLAERWSEVVVPWLIALYGATALAVVCRWLLGYIALGRILRRSTPAPAEIVKLFESLFAPARVPRLLVSRRLRVPISCGLLKPAIVLPLSLCDPPLFQRLRWVFAHELTHVQRRDAWSALLLGLGQAIYFYLPWFWWLRRQVRLCQEYVADAVAAEQAEPAADYAEFLLSLTGAPAVPLAATGVSGHSSDLYRRVSMLLTEPVRVEKRCPRPWSLAAAGGLLSLAVIVAGIGLRAEPVAADVVAYEPAVVATQAEPFEIVIEDIPAIVWKTEKAPDGKQVRVIVLAASEKVRPAGDVMMLKQVHDKIIVIKRGPQGKVEELKDVLIRRIDGPGGSSGIAIVRGSDTTKIDELRNALRKVLDKLEKDGARFDAEQIRRDLEKALEQLRKAPHIRQPSDLKELKLKEFKIEAKKRPLDIKPKEANVDALRKALEALEKQGVNVEQIRKELEKALKHLRDEKKPANFEIEIDPFQKRPFAGKKVEFRPGQRIEVPVPGEKIDVDKVRDLLKDLLKQGVVGQEEVRRALEALGRAQSNHRDRVIRSYPGPTGKGRLGIHVDKPAAALADQLNLPAGQGLVITNVDKDSPAEKAGLRINDVLLQLNQQAVPSEVGDFVKMLDAVKPGTTLEAVVFRKGKRQTIKGIQLAGGAPPQARSALAANPAVNVFTTLSRDGKRFTATHKEDKLTITVKGEVADGKAKVEEIRIQDGGGVTTHQSVRDVPDAVRARVQRLVELATKGEFELEIRE
jgi:beta-lactamase regulating signal transducer with metallopeptidase domain